MSRRRRNVVGGAVAAAPVPPWLALGPSYSYVADSSWMVLTGGTQVESWADELDPVAAKDIAQPALLNQPTYLPDAGTPSGNPGVKGDGLAAYLLASRVVGYGSGPLTAYHVIVRGAVTIASAVFGEYGFSSNQARQRRDAASLRSNIGGVLVSAPGAPAAGDPLWFEYVFDGATLEANTAAGNASLSSGTTSTTVLAAFARMTGGGVTPSQFGDDTLLWAFGYPRVLSPAERTIARDAAQARIG